MDMIMFGGGAPANFTDVSNSSALEIVAFSDKAPTWNKACAGLNVEGRCANHSCQAYRQMVIDPKGMVSWSLIAGPGSLPNVPQAVSISHLCLYQMFLGI
ncbi:hypothetical protein ABBQ32_011721 [Trebouxia sp. C0010 RCD-2024]